MVVTGHGLSFAVLAAGGDASTGRACLRDNCGGHSPACDECRSQGGKEAGKGQHFGDVLRGKVCCQRLIWLVKGTVLERMVLFSTEQTSTSTRELDQEATLICTSSWLCMQRTRRSSLGDNGHIWLNISPFGNSPSAQLHVLASLSVPAAVDNDENGGLKSNVMVLFIALATSFVCDKLLWACRLQSSGYLRL